MEKTLEYFEYWLTNRTNRLDKLDIAIDGDNIIIPHWQFALYSKEYQEQKSQITTLGFLLVFMSIALIFVLLVMKP